MNEMREKYTDYTAAYAVFQLPVEREPRPDQNPMHFEKVSLLTEVNVSYSANSSTLAAQKL